MAALGLLKDIENGAVCRESLQAERIFRTVPGSSAAIGSQQSSWNCAHTCSHTDMARSHVLPEPIWVPATLGFLNMLSFQQETDPSGLSRWTLSQTVPFQLFGMEVSKSQPHL